MNVKNFNSVITSDTVRHVAKLARLALTDDEIEQTKIDLTNILSHIDRLQDADTEGIEPLDHPTGQVNRDRDDAVGESLSQQQVLANAPAVKDVFIDVPKVLGGTA